MKKLLLCVGAAKTGTTWLYQNLRHHPSLHFTPEKELNFFFTQYGAFNRLSERARFGKLAEFFDRARTNFVKDVPDDLFRRRLGPFHRNLGWYKKFANGQVGDEWYRRLFQRMEEGQFACDFSPSTSLISDEGWAHVAGFADEVKVIYVLRRPDERLWSHAKFHAAFIGKFAEFSKMSTAEMHAMAERCNLLADGDYGTILGRLSAHIPAENRLCIDYARIGAEPESVLNDVAGFLGVANIAPPEGKPGGKVNVSEKLPKPAAFGAPYRQRFEKETRLLVEQGVGFAKAWL
ncbi:MAG: sulfotransferase domain-containing protein [Paracoccaceae bacterium]